MWKTLLFLILALALIPASPMFAQGPCVSAEDISWDDANLRTECGTKYWQLAVKTCAEGLFCRDNNSELKWSYGVCIQSYTNCAGQYVQSSVKYGNEVMIDVGTEPDGTRKVRYETDDWSDTYSACNPDVPPRLVNTEHNNVQTTYFFYYGCC